MRPYNEPNLRRTQYEQLLQELEKDTNEGETPQSIATIIEKIKILEEFTLDKKRFFCLFDHKLYRPIYVSDNVSTEGGYDLAKYSNQGLQVLFKRIHWKQLTLVYKALVWKHRFRKFIGKDKPLINNQFFYTGVKFIDRWGKSRTVFLTQKMLRATKNNKISLSFFEAEEITDIYKGNFVWARLTNTTNNEFNCRVYFSSGSKKEHADLLTDRELEILHLVVERKSSKEIGEQLSISPNTVLRHRKNMIAKAGVTDMTALIHICQLCQIL